MTGTLETIYIDHSLLIPLYRDKLFILKFFYSNEPICIVDQHADINLHCYRHLVIIPRVEDYSLWLPVKVRTLKLSSTTAVFTSGTKGL